MFLALVIDRLHHHISELSILRRTLEETKAFEEEETKAFEEEDET